jgi:ribosomal-protein-alanine N-acetyltransferase
MTSVALGRRHPVYVRQPTLDDQKAFITAARASRSLHGAWVSAPDTPARYRDYLSKMALPANHAFLVVHRGSEGLVGVLNITNIIMGGFRSAFLGYYAFAGYEGQGLMKLGMQQMLRQAFGRLKLHRIEANIQPGNAPSIALAKSCSFQLEGYSPRYLKIAGRWRDHERWAIVAD